MAGWIWGLCEAGMFGEKLKRYFIRLDDFYRTRSLKWRVRHELPGPFHERKGIFIHIPKAAGTSVSLALYGHQIGHHRIVDFFEADYPATKSYFKFCFVRDPYDRVVSAFNFLKAGGMNENDKAFAERHLAGLEFGEFVERLAQDRQLLDWWHFRPQHSWVCSPERPDRVLVDFVGRFETIEQDFAHICARLGMQADLPKTNASKRPTGSAARDPAIEQMVRGIYRQDYELFAYD